MKVLIIGGGELGGHVLQALPRTTECCVIEIDEEKCRILQEKFPDVTILQGSGSDVALLESVECEQMDVVLAMSNRDEVNLVVATICKFDFGVSQVIARANESEHRWLFTAENGVDATIVQTDLIVQGMIQRLQEIMTAAQFD